MAIALHIIHSNNIHTFSIDTADAPFTMMPLPPILRRNDKAKALHVPDTGYLVRGAHLRTQYVWKGTCMRSGRCAVQVYRTTLAQLQYSRKSLLVASFAEHAVQVMRMEALVFKVVRTDVDLN